MTKEEFVKNLESCSKNELIEMMVIQWLGLESLIEQMKLK